LGVEATLRGIIYLKKKQPKAQVRLPAIFGLRGGHFFPPTPANFKIIALRAGEPSDKFPDAPPLHALTVP
jgi:hypothetical protein